jgi:hypothetical protein
LLQKYNKKSYKLAHFGPFLLYNTVIATQTGAIMKQTYTMYIYKLDRRCKTGERLVSTTVWRDRDEAGMKREVNELLLSGLYTVDKYRIVFHATMKTVKSLMTGKEVQIDRDTPWCCNPASESFWSM